MTLLSREIVVLGFVGCGWACAAVAASRYASEFGKAKPWALWFFTLSLGPRYWTTTGRRLILAARASLAIAVLTLLWW